jgi:excisionase family DNA binding protein
MHSLDKTEVQRLSEFLRVCEVAERLGLHKATVYRLMSQGEIPSVRIGPRVLRVPSGALQEWATDRALASVKGAEKT